MAEEEHIEDAPVRPLWSGTISFGLVSVPVNLYPGNRPGGIGLRMLGPDGAPLRRRFFCPAENREVHPEHIIRGYPIGDDQYVVVRDEELEALEPQKSRDIDLRRFVPIEQIDPLYFERAYFLTPASDSNKAYRLLAATMERAGRAGIATFVMREREYLVAILAEGGILRAQTLRFHDELRTPEDVGLPARPEPERALVSEFAREVQKLNREDLDEDELRDRAAERLRKLAADKQREDIDVVALAEAEDEDSDAPVDLMSVIQRSLQAAQKASEVSEGSAKRPRAAAREPAVSRRRPAPEPKDRPAPRGGEKHSSGREADLRKLSRAELYERAQALEIPGRSGMTKEELLAAIRMQDR
jgi:DNA end-binding protein Ku